MSRKHRKDSPPSITTGNVQGTGIVVGNNSSVSVKRSSSPVSVDRSGSGGQQDAIAMLDDFIQLISRDGGSLSDASAVAQSAEEVREEMTKPAPKWTAVRTILTSIAGAVTEISTLAAAVKDIQALVTHITG